MAFSDPISTSLPTYASKSNLVTQPSASTWWGPNIQFPYPTNDWFMDFVLPTTATLQATGDDRRICVWPYLVQAQSSGLGFNHPFIRKSPDVRTIRSEHRINYDPSATNWGWTSDASPQIWRSLDLIFGATETITSRYLDRYDQLSATLRWNVDATHYMEAPVVRGMPYVTMRYTALTPSFTTDNTDYHSIATINGSAPSGTVSGTKFKLTINRPYLGASATETWILYASSSISFTASPSGLVAQAPFTGYLRAAKVPTATPSQEVTLDTHAHAVPIAGSTAVSVNNDSSTTTFTFTKLGVGSTILTYCLLQHEDTLSAANYASNFNIPTIRGQLRAVIGNTWTMFDSLTSVTWDSMYAIDSDKRTAIETALAVEKNLYDHRLDASDISLFGKQISRASRLALIANTLDDTPARDAITAAMKVFLNPWLDNDAGSVSSRSLMYDTTWGGVLSNSAHSVSPADDPQSTTAEAGNAVYNDHHYHWGYVIYAAAVIARFDSDWLAAYKSKVNNIVRDIANPSASDPYFTQLRYFDWYEGHSWGSGLQTNGDGRSQESSSEAVNAWYGISLWGLVSGQADLRNVGRYLLAKETHSSSLYWQMPSYYNTYPTDFAARRVISQIYTNKVLVATRSGQTADDVVLAIETMPYTPASHELLSASWVQEAYADTVADNSTPSTATKPGGWLGYTYGAQAVIDPNTAYANIEANISVSDNDVYLDKYGTSKTNLLWWSAVQGASGAAPTGTITTIDVSPVSPVDIGQSLSITATITPTCEGMVTFRDGTSEISTVMTSGGVANISTSLSTSGPHTLTATFAPSDMMAYAGSSSSAALYTVNGGGVSTTSTSLSISPTGNAVAGAVVTLSAVVSPSAPGSVTFYDGSTPMITVPVISSNAITTTTSLSVGSHILSATFTTDDSLNYTDSTSPSFGYTIYAPGAMASSTNVSAETYRGFSYGQPIAALYSDVADIDYVVSPTDSIIGFTSLSAARSVTLPPPSDLPGRVLIIKDETGSCSALNSLVLSGTIDDAPNFTLNTPYAYAKLYAGDDSWYLITP